MKELYAAPLYVISIHSLIVSCTGPVLPGCLGPSTDAAIELVENDPNATIVCTGVRNLSTVKWSAGTEDVTCPPTGYCINSSFLAATRSSDKTSLIFKFKVERTAIPENTTVTCQVDDDPANCNVDVVYPPEVMNCTAYPVRSDTTWNVSGNCIISKVFSLRKRYYCELLEQKEGSSADTVSQTTYIPNFNNESPQYASGTCFYTTNLPLVNANYAYSVKLSSVSAVKPAGTLIAVGEPSSAPIFSCTNSGTSSQYVPENATLACNCTASHLGEPQGRLVAYNGTVRLSVGTYNVRSLVLTIQKISRNDNGTILTCAVDWATPDDRDRRSTPYQVVVSYGPDMVTLKGTSVFDLHPTQPGFLTLTCTASMFNPGVSYVWNHLCANDASGSTCRFTPNVSDHNTRVTCTVVNTETRVTRSASTNITLNWPPITPPNITGYSNGERLYAGHDLNIWCDITGGNPPVSSALILCQSHQGQVITVQNNTVTLQVSASHNNAECTCNGTWKIATWYKQTASVNLTVYYPPQKPNITFDSHQYTYPFLVGDKPSLYCLWSNNTDQGNPSATLTWLDQHGQSVDTLPLGPLTVADNGRRIQCEAVNDFTVWNRTHVVTEMSLVVYYHPIVTFTSLSENRCQFRNTSNCIVYEGERVRVNCTANSNPAPANITWTQSGNTSAILDFIANRTSDIVFTCNVNTRILGNDDRLPLNSSQQITVLVTYPSNLNFLTINEHEDNVTVSEGDTVNITCTAAGRPTPAVKLTFYGVQVSVRAKGEITTDHLVTLTYTSTRAACSMSGTYICDVTNDLGPNRSRSVDLFVNCMPRLDANSQPDAKYNYISHPIYINFTLLTYPATNIHYLQYNHITPVPGASDFRPARETLYSVVCEKTDRVYRTYCTLRIDNVTATDEGQYKVVFENHIGNFNFIFQLDVNRTSVEEATPETIIGAAVGGALGAAVVAIIAAVVAVFFIKRMRAKGNPTSERDRSLIRKTDGKILREAEAETMIVNTLYGTAAVTAAHECQTPTSSCYEDVGVLPTSKPEVQPKPHVAAKMPATNDGKNTYSIVQSKLANNLADTVGYASVNKSKTADEKNREAALRTGNTAKNKSEAIQKPTKKPKPAKNKYKGKINEQRKEGAVHGNMPLSMKPIDSKVYENIGFQNEESETNLRDAPQQSAAAQRSATNDGLVYTTIQFTESQQKKAEHTPPKRETTEYVSIVLNKQPAIKP